MNALRTYLLAEYFLYVTIWYTPCVVQNAYEYEMPEFTIFVIKNNVKFFENTENFSHYLYKRNKFIDVNYFAKRIILSTDKVLIFF